MSPWLLAVVFWLAAVAAQIVGREISAFVIASQAMLITCAAYICDAIKERGK